MESGIFKQDLVKFEHVYPTEYPQQSTLFDCGLFLMLFVGSWDGKMMDTLFPPGMINDYRKHVAGSLIISRNEIPLAEFVKEHCMGKTKT